MQDINIKDIKKAMETLEKHEVEPTKITMSPIMADKVIRMLNENGIRTKGKDGNDYVLGAKVIIEEACAEDVAILS